MKFIDWFAGIGGFRRGMELAGHKCVGFCEYDKFATASYTSMHLITEEQREYLATLDIKARQKEILKEEYRNGEWYRPDITKITASEVPAADCWCFGAPCLVAGTLITTSEGLKPIEDVCVGDYVLTHRNRFRRVVETMVNTKQGIYTIKALGSLETVCTGNHRFYVRYRTQKFNSKTRLYDPVWSEPEWKAAEDLSGEEYILMPRNMESKNIMSLSNEECWLLGRYVADGYLQSYKRKNRPSKSNRTVFCIGSSKIEEFESHIFGYKMHQDNFQKSCRKYVTLDKRLFALCSEFGRGASNKRIPGFIMDLPKEMLHEFLNGYISGDGCMITLGAFSATTVSKQLAFQIAQIVLKVYGTHSCINRIVPQKARLFKEPGKPDRIINQKPHYTVRYHEEPKKQSHAKSVDGNIWTPIKIISYEPERIEEVFNIGVEEDESYTANNLGLHNCQSFSVAGRREGMDGQSGLIREIFRLLGEIREEDRPEWLLYENVKGMLSSNRGFDFLAILLEMDKWGYDIQWDVLNSKNFGVPQNRERCFTVGHIRTRGFAKVFPLERTDGADSVRGVNQIGQDGKSKRNNPNQYRVYDPNGVSPCLNQMEGGGREPHTIQVIGKAYDRENYGDNRNRILGSGGVAPSLTATQYKEPYRVGLSLSEIQTLRGMG